MILIIKHIVDTVSLNDTYYKAHSRHYSGERFDERELSYLRNRHFDRDYYDDDFYYHRHRGDIY